MQVEVRAIGMLSANCYILDKRIMVDPGDSVPELDAFVRDTGADIRSVVITHGHFDHMLGAAHMQRDCGAKILISEPDAHSLRDEATALCLPYAATKFEPIEPDRLLKEGRAEIEGTEFEILLTPGHTPGGICLISRAEHCVFTGDTLFKYGYGRTDFPGGSEVELFRSLRRLMRLPAEYTVYPGHGESATIGEITGG